MHAPHCMRRTARRGKRMLDGGERHRCRVGDAVVTAGGDLAAKWCVHAVGPDYSVETRTGKSYEDCDALVRSAYTASMQRAQESRQASRKADKWKAAIGEIAKLSTSFATLYMRPLRASPWI